MLSKRSLIDLVLLSYSDDLAFKRYVDRTINDIKVYHPEYSTMSFLALLDFIYVNDSDNLAKRLLDNYETLKGKEPYSVS